MFRFYSLCLSPISELLSISKMKLTSLVPILSCLILATGLPIEQDQNDAAIYSRTIPGGLRHLFARVETPPKGELEVHAQHTSAEPASAEAPSTEPVTEAVIPHTTGTIESVPFSEGLSSSGGGSGVGGNQKRPKTLFKFVLEIENMDPEVYGKHIPGEYPAGYKLYKHVRAGLEHWKIDGIPDFPAVMHWEFKVGPENKPKVSFLTKAIPKVAVSLTSVWQQEMGTLKITPKQK